MSSAEVIFVIPAFEPTLAQESIGTLILANILQKNGISTNIVRFWEGNGLSSDYSLFINSLKDIILLHSPKIVSFYCRATEYHICIDISLQIKKESKDINIVFGGPQAELVSVQTLDKFPHIDYICCGEGETTIVPFIKNLLINHDNNWQDSVNGLVFHRGNKVIKNKLPKLLSNNYRIDYHYYSLIPQIVFNKSSEIGIDTGRGCPYSCSFCSSKTFWKQSFRLRDINDSLDEIGYVIQNYGIRKFSFGHDLFTGNKNRVMDFCSKIKERRYHILWSCSSRVNTIDTEMIDKMCESGLCSIYYGIETGSQRIQNIINKKLNLEKAIDIIKYSVSKGLSVTTSFIYGFPEECEKDIEKTFSFIQQCRELGVKNIQLHRLNFDNGTSLSKLFYDKLVVPKIDPFINHIWGLYENATTIYSHKEVFTSFYDHPSAKRKEMKYLPVFNILCSTYPKTTSYIFQILKSNGFGYLFAYRIFVKQNQEILSIISNQTKYSKDIISSSQLAFFVEKFVIAILNLEISNSHLSIDKQYLSMVYEKEKKW